MRHQGRGRTGGIEIAADGDWRFIFSGVFHLRFVSTHQIPDTQA
jgi:hypothetical protein